MSNMPSLFSSPLATAAPWLWTCICASLSKMFQGGDGGSRVFPAFLQGTRMFADHADHADLCSHSQPVPLGALQGCAGQ